MKKLDIEDNLSDISNEEVRKIIKKSNIKLNVNEIVLRNQFRKARNWSEKENKKSIRNF